MEKVAARNFAHRWMTTTTKSTALGTVLNYDGGDVSPPTTFTLRTWKGEGKQAVSSGGEFALASLLACVAFTLSTLFQTSFSLFPTSSPLLLSGSRQEEEAQNAHAYPPSLLLVPPSTKDAIPPWPARPQKEGGKPANNPYFPSQAAEPLFTPIPHQLFPCSVTSVPEKVLLVVLGTLFLEMGSFSLGFCGGSLVSLRPLRVNTGGKSLLLLLTLSSCLRILSPNYFQIARFLEKSTKLCS